IEKTSEVFLICDINNGSWMTPLLKFLNTGKLPDEKKEPARIKRRACAYVILDGKLYRRGFSILKFLARSDQKFYAVVRSST
ncbi:hypothetical protein A2U01_0089241, partial [Trifolium medium]|nr:hypothetical protein [Trifolium medium]